MKFTTKLLIITLLTLSFFMAEPKNITQTDTNFTVAKENTGYEQISGDKPTARPRSINIFKLT